MGLLDDLNDVLDGQQPGPTTPAPPPKAHAVGQNGGDIVVDGKKLGELRETNIDPHTFEVKYRLTIHPEMWKHVEVVCDGNATEVQTEPLGDGRYRVKRRLAGYKPSMVDREDTIELREFESTKDFINWIETLSTDDVEALRQIYYDRWTFDTANQKDRMYYELLEEEKKGRKK